MKNRNNSQKITAVKTFTEKPNPELAKAFYDSKEFLWNTGIFIWKTRDIIREFQTHMFALHFLNPQYCPTRCQMTLLSVL